MVHLTAASSSHCPARASNGLVSATIDSAPIVCAERLASAVLGEAAFHPPVVLAAPHDGTLLLPLASADTRAKQHHSLEPFLCCPHHTPPLPTPLPHITPPPSAHIHHRAFTHRDIYYSLLLAVPFFVARDRSPCISFRP